MIFRAFSTGLDPFTYKDVVKTSGAERQSGGQLGHGFEPIHIQGCRQKHVKKSTIFRVSNTGLDPFTYKDVVKTSGAERQSGGQLGHGFEPIHKQGCRQNHVKKSTISRVFNTGLDPFIYNDVAKTMFQNRAKREFGG